MVLFVFLHAGLSTVLDFLASTREIKHPKMVAALTPSFIILCKNKALVFGFCLNHKVTILAFKNFLNFSFKVIQSFSDSLDFVGGDTAGFELNLDEFMKFFGSELLFWKPQSCVWAFGYFFLDSYQIDEMLKSTQFWQLQLFGLEFISL